MLVHFLLSVHYFFQIPSSRVFISTNPGSLTVSFSIFYIILRIYFHLSKKYLLLHQVDPFNHFPVCCLPSRNVWVPSPLYKPCANSPSYVSPSWLVKIPIPCLKLSFHSPTYFPPSAPVRVSLSVV